MKRLDTSQVFYLHDLMCGTTGGPSGVRDTKIFEPAIYFVECTG